MPCSQSAVTANKIGDVGAQALAKALESSRTLSTLNLSRASLTAVVVVSVWLCVLLERLWLS
jgi:hypothetical protein